MNHIFSRLTRLALVGTALAILSGCAAMGGYDDQFACPKAPQGSPCMSAIDAYHASDNGLPAAHADTVSIAGQHEHPAPVMRGPRRGMGPRGHTASATHEAEHQAAPVREREAATPAPALGPMLRALDTPRPIRTPAKVMRIYIAPWVGKDGDLTMPTYVFTEIEPRRWTIGETMPSETAPRFYALQVKHKQQSDGGGSPDHHGSASAARIKSINQ